MSNLRDRAVVLGGSIAGLLAARVLADEYATVTIVERDRLPAGPAHRRGVPHGHHVHGLLPRGVHVMNELLPGLTDEIVAAGGLPGDILANVRWYLNGRRLPQARTGLGAVSASRPLIEDAIRQRVLDHGGIEVLDGHDLVGLTASPDRSRVTGARVTSRYGSGSRVLPADLVVDATGRGSRTPRWLAELGYQEPPQDRVGIDLVYASRVVDAGPDPLGGDTVVVTARFPGQRRSAVMQRIEGGRTLVTLAGILGERPPLDLDGFIGYARTLAAPDTYDLLRAARPVGEPAPFRCPAYVRHRYERLTELPAGLLVLGDAMCSFNPVYAQGMSVAAVNAQALREELRHGHEPDPHRYFAAAARAVDAPWLLAVGADLAVAGVTGPVLPASPLCGEYLARLQRAAAEDAELAAAFVRVTSLVDPPTALLRPEVADRVERAAAAAV
jgi:2-polyprenyl-6-methoxyphenol hydroxylase-like FAD-dependent oxidoreductase